MLGAIAVGGGLATGMTLAQCAEGIASVAPFDGRMQPVTTPDGVTFIRDDFKAPLWTLDACLEFMKTAQAKRKIIVIGTLSDYGIRVYKSRKFAESMICQFVFLPRTQRLSIFQFGTRAPRLNNDTRLTISNIDRTGHYSRGSR